MEFNITKINSVAHLPYFIREEDRRNLCTVRNKYGKEIDPNNQFFISSSDSSTLKVSVMSKKPIGIDIETERVINPKSYDFFLNQKEKDMLKASEHESIPLLLWMIKESFLKLLGTGLHIHPKKITISQKRILINDLSIRCKIQIFKYQHFYITILEA